jgi:hypothetical protein
MRTALRPTLSAVPAALALTLSLAVGVSAQVASLASPDETETPEEAVDTILLEDREEALLAYAECMRDNGIDMDDPMLNEAGSGRVLGLGGGQRQVDRFGEDFRVAQEACVSYLEAARPDIDPEAEQERLEEQLLLAQCIRDAGYPEYPDPAIGTDGRLQRVRGDAMQDIGIDRRSPEFQAVMGDCRDEIGIEGFGPGGAGGPGPVD